MDPQPILSRHAFTALSFAEPAQQQELIAALEKGAVASFRAVEPKAFFELARTHLQEGLFADPIYGGNRDKAGWRFLGHPGVWLENSAEENLTGKPVDKGGEIRSLADLDLPSRERTPIAGYDPHRGTAESVPEADVLIVGAGTVGSLVARRSVHRGGQQPRFRGCPHG
jgi:gluconate 2-dehydrogenase alpha chain